MESARKSLVFCKPRVYEKKVIFWYHDFWVGGKNFIVKNDCIFFPKSQYVNSNPALLKYLDY